MAEQGKRQRRTGTAPDFRGAAFWLSGALVIVASALILSGRLAIAEPDAADVLLRGIAALSSAVVVACLAVAYAYRAKRPSTVGADATESLPIPLVSVSPAGKVVAANAVARRVLGVQPGRIGAIASMAPIVEALGKAGAHGPAPTHDDQRTGRKYAVLTAAMPDGGTLVRLEETTAAYREAFEKGEYLGLVSHGLREPLGAADWLVDMLGESGKLNRDQARTIGELRDILGSMRSSLDRLTLAARIESGSLRTGGLPADVPSAVRSALRGLAGEIEARRLSVRTSFPEGLPALPVDKDLLRMAVGELVSNAVRHNRDGGSLEASASSDGRRLEIRIADGGRGVPERLGADIFRKFVRGDNLEGADKGGGGIGLHLVRSVVEASGGAVRFTSKEGEGSVFYVSFPLAKAETSGEAMEPAVEAGNH